MSISRQGKSEETTSMKLDITSTVAEKSIEAAKGFLDKLLVPAVEETGLLLKDKIAHWRFRNQVRVLGRAKEYCEKKGISPKQVSFKLICPLLEYAGLEEEENMQDRWAVLLANLVDSEQNIENHVFPYILSQISLKEFEVIEEVANKKKDENSKLREELKQVELRISDKVKELKEMIGKVKSGSPEKYELQEELNRLEKPVHTLRSKLEDPIVLDDEKLREFEVANLARLGLIKYVIRHYAAADPILIPRTSEYDFHDSTQVDVDIDIETEEEYYVLTELGEMFVQACSERY
jgi:hypothetical protein